MIKGSGSRPPAFQVFPGNGAGNFKGMTWEARGWRPPAASSSPHKPEKQPCGGAPPRNVSWCDLALALHTHPLRTSVRHFDWCMSANTFRMRASQQTVIGVDGILPSSHP